ncbi:hypothetical protein ACW0JT_05595 [Arthrobacter sp. SA17]
MSTVDPAIAARARRDKRPSNARMIVVLVLQFLGGGLTGYGWGSFGSLFGEPDQNPDVPMHVAMTLVTVATIPLGMILMVGSTIAYGFSSLKRADVGLGYGLAAGLLGGGSGLLVASMLGRGSVVVVVIGLVLLGLGVAALIRGATIAASRTRAAARQQETMRTGALTTAKVSARGMSAFGKAPAASPRSRSPSWTWRASNAGYSGQCSFMPRIPSRTGRKPDYGTTPQTQVTRSGLLSRLPCNRPRRWEVSVLRGIGTRARKDCTPR